MNFKIIEIATIVLSAFFLMMPIVLTAIKIISKHIWLPFIYRCKTKDLYAINPFNGKKLFKLDEDNTLFKTRNGDIYPMNSYMEVLKSVPLYDSKINLQCLLSHGFSSTIIFNDKFKIILY